MSDNNWQYWVFVLRILLISTLLLFVFVSNFFFYTGKNTTIKLNPLISCEFCKIFKEYLRATAFMLTLKKSPVETCLRRHMKICIKFRMRAHSSEACSETCQASKWDFSVWVFLVRIFPYSNWIRRDTPNAGKYGPEKLVWIVNGKPLIRCFTGQSIQEWTKRNLWKIALKKFEVIWSA